MTLGRCSTNGASGTFIDEQCGASASATERTAYSCSSRSLLRAGQRRGQGQVVGVVAGAPDRAGQHPGGDQALLAADQQLRGGADAGRRRRRSSVPRSARPAAAAASAGRSAPRRVPREVAGQHDLVERRRRRSAPTRLGDGAAPSRRRRARRRRRRRRPGRAGACCGAGTAAAGSCAPTADRGHPPAVRPRRPTTTSGTTRAPPLGGVGGERRRTRRRPARCRAGRPRRARRRAPRRRATTRSACGEPVRPRRLERAARSPQPTRPVAAPDPGHDVGAGTAAAAPAAAPGPSIATVRATTGAGRPVRRGRGRGRARTSRPASLRRLAARRRGSPPARAGDRVPPPPRRAIGTMSAMTRASLDKAPHEVAAMFDDVAERYDLTNDVLSLGQDRRWRRAVVDGRRPRGPGETGARPRRRHRHQQRAVRRRRRRRGAGRLLPGHAAGRQRAAAPTWPFTAADAMRLPFADDSFDAVTISFGLRNVADPDAGAARVAAGHPARRPAGRLRVQPARSTGAVPRRSTPSTSCARCPAIARRVSSNPESYVYLAESIRAWPDQRGARRGGRGRRLGATSRGATSPAASSPCTAPPPDRASRGPSAGLGMPQQTGLCTRA